MVQLIIFYCLFIAYLIFSILYIIKHYRRYRDEDKVYQGEELDIDFRSVSRLLMYITIAVTLVCSELYFSVSDKTNITPGQIGISLASGTFIFFVLFLLWDISRPRIIKFFKIKHNIEVRKETVFGLSIITTISLFAILLLETVLSVIGMVRGDF